MSTEHSPPLWILGEQDGCFSFMPRPTSLILCWLEHLQRTQASCMQIPPLIFPLPLPPSVPPFQNELPCPCTRLTVLLKGGGVSVVWAFDTRKENETEFVLLKNSDWKSRA